MDQMDQALADVAAANGTVMPVPFECPEFYKCVVTCNATFNQTANITRNETNFTVPVEVAPQLVEMMWSRTYFGNTSVGTENITVPANLPKSANYFSLYHRQYKYYQISYGA